jgi:hypothetical protein
MNLRFWTKDFWVNTSTRQLTKEEVEFKHYSAAQSLHTIIKQAHFMQAIKINLESSEYFTEVTNYSPNIPRDKAITRTQPHDLAMEIIFWGENDERKDYYYLPNQLLQSYLDYLRDLFGNGQSLTVQTNLNQTIRTQTEIYPSPNGDKITITLYYQSTQL